MNVLIAGGGTGGHLVPALAIADALRECDAGVRLMLVGALRGIEAKILPGRIPIVPFRLVPAAPLYRRQWWRNAGLIWTGPRLITACRRVLREHDPAVIVSTGGYAAGAVSYLGARLGIPLVVQEQNALPGLTTRLLVRHATEVYVGYPEAADRLGLAGKVPVLVTGNPVQPPDLDRATARKRLGIKNDARVLLVMGGSQGAAAINNAVREGIEGKGLEDLTLLWATGDSHFGQLKHLDAAPLRQVRGFWSPMGEAYAAADLVVCRAGAMTTAELEAWGRPAILIPLPTAADDHQTVNARALEAAGAAVHLPQSQLTAELLLASIRSVLDSPDGLRSMAAAAAARGKPDASRQIAGRILKLAR